jgi:hypothetical protein
MRNGDISKIILLSKNIQEYLKNIIKSDDTRCRKTALIDGIIFKLYYSKKETSQESAAIKLNEVMNRNTIQNKISRQSYISRENSIDISIYKGLYDLIDTFSTTHFYDNRIRQTYAVDGTQINLSKKLSKDGLKVTKNDNIVNGLVMGIYNVTYNYPVSLSLSNDKNERKAYTEFIKNTDQYKECIFIFDRGFMDHKLFKLLDDKNIFYLCRIRHNYLAIPTDSNDKVVHDKHNNRMRILTYLNNNNTYYLATNLFDTKEYAPSKLKSLYHKRWNIEEYFKYIKLNTSFNRLLEKDKKSIMKTIYSQLIISRIVDLFARIKGTHKKNNTMIINKTTLTNALYNDFLIKFMYNKNINRRSVRQFLTISALYTHSQKGKSYERTSFKPYSKWYIKKYYSKYISNSENKERVATLNKERINKKNKEKRNLEQNNNNSIT